MTLFTYQHRLEEAAKEAENKSQLMHKVNCVIFDMLQEDECLWGIGRQIAGFGTWRMTLWVNEYAFGHDLAERLNNHYIVTHDEDKVFTLYDFEDIISDVCWEYALYKF